MKSAFVQTLSVALAEVLGECDENLKLLGRHVRKDQNLPVPLAKYLMEAERIERGEEPSEMFREAYEKIRLVLQPLGS